MSRTSYVARAVGPWALATLLCPWFWVGLWELLPDRGVYAFLPVLLGVASTVVLGSLTASRWEEAVAEGPELDLEWEQRKRREGGG